AREAGDRARTKIVILKTARARANTAATGFLAAPRLVITAGHAIAGAVSVTGWVNGVGYPAQTAGVDADRDLAALRLSAPELELKPVVLARSSQALQENEELVIPTGPSQGPEARGDPAERLLLPARFVGRRYARNAAGKVDLVLTLQAHIRRGDSGSPVIRARDGTVVGVVTSRQLPDENDVSYHAYAVPVEGVRAWLEALPNARPAPREEFYLFPGGGG
ncbi:MAG TPA: serine protease, partial [Armatimonadota bacterium]|nr:serine protease [Armatimonadota bacterium]